MKWTVSIQTFRISRNTPGKLTVAIQSLAFPWREVTRKRTRGHCPTSSSWKIARRRFLVWESVPVRMAQWRMEALVAVLEATKGRYRMWGPILVANSWISKMTTSKKMMQRMTVTQPLKTLWSLKRARNHHRGKTNRPVLTCTVISKFENLSGTRSMSTWHKNRRTRSQRARSPQISAHLLGHQSPSLDRPSRSKCYIHQ